VFFCIHPSSFILPRIAGVFLAQSLNPRGGHRQLLAPHLPGPLFRFPLSALRFQLSAFQDFSFLLRLLLGFSTAYFRPRMFAPSTHPLGFLLSAFYFQLSSPTCAGFAAGGR
jgi:hypothetical protein